MTHTTTTEALASANVGAPKGVLTMRLEGCKCRLEQWPNGDFTGWNASDGRNATEAQMAALTAEAQKRGLAR